MRQQFPVCSRMSRFPIRMKEKDRRFIRRLGMLSTMALTPVFAMGIGFIIGIKLDRWLGTSPWLTGFFVVLGIVAGFREFYRFVKRSQENLEDEESKHD
jgi:ATP synthase protein I